MNPADTLAIVGGRIVTPGGVAPGSVLIEGSQIKLVGDLPQNYDGTVIDASELLVAPGFVDTQVNGGFGIDLAEDPNGMWELGGLLIEDGVTSFLPTIVTSSPATIDNALDAFTSAPPGYQGAQPLGLHLEGPMLNPARAGAHQVALLREPSVQLSRDWAPSSGVAMVTLAPELPGALEVVQALSERGVVVAAGHSEASFEEMSAAVAAGVSHVTHLYNAMPRMHHRRPGLLGFALASAAVTAGIIVDGVHSHPGAVGVAWGAKPQNLALVTDAAPARGLSPGSASLGQTEVALSADGTIRTADGTLAGANLAMDQAVRNLAGWTGCEVHEAISSASLVPARIIGATGKGRIGPGLDADIVLLDRNLDVVATIVNGRRLFRR